MFIFKLTADLSFTLLPLYCFEFKWPMRLEKLILPKHYRDRSTTEQHLGKNASKPHLIQCRILISCSWLGSDRKMNRHGRGLWNWWHQWRVRTNRKSQSRDCRARNWMYCSHNPECIVTANPNRSVLIMMVTWHVSFHRRHLHHIWNTKIADDFILGITPFRIFCILCLTSMGRNLPSSWE